MRDLNPLSFEDFLNSWHLTPEDIIGLCTPGGKRMLESIAEENDAHDISISSLFVFCDCGGYSSNSWYKIRDEWEIVRHRNSKIPFYKAHQQYQQPLKELYDKKFNEELL